MSSQAALQRLNNLLPLTERQQVLPIALIQLHQTILLRWFETGSPPTFAELARRWPELGLLEALAQLNRDDLIVLADARTIIGAYPLTLEETPHQVRANGHILRAMCAIDALAISPLYGQPTQIESRCRMTDTPILLRQDGNMIIEAQPSRAIQVGIHWQPPQSCAAHSLCREMVFLADAAAAAAWQAIAPSQRDRLTLAEAIELGDTFFAPLLAKIPLQQ